MTASELDRDAIAAKYAAERDKRLRPENARKYVRLDDIVPVESDPYTPVIEREPKRDHVTFAFIGGGLSGLVAGARLREIGVDVRIIDKAGDFGGVWYWNRYPGAMCDTASMVYMPLLEETGHVPTEKYAHQPEILKHCQQIAKQYDLYSDALFHTVVTGLEWQDDQARWLIRTDRGDEFTAQFVGMGTGELHVPKVPDVEGIRAFRGHIFHSAHWDYRYTGGDASGAPMTNLADKRVAVIGTGASSIQCVPELAKYAKDVYVVQRTPNAVDVRGNRPIDPEWFESVATPGWQQRWFENYLSVLSGGVRDDLVKDGFSELALRIAEGLASVPEDERTPDRMVEAFDDADLALMERIRARVDDVIEDPEVAEKLKAWYRRLCKRPVFHDEYLQAFNLPNTHLVDTDGRGLERLTETGFVAGGKEHDVDLVVFASGFEVRGNEYHERNGYDPVGQNGLRLSDHWSEGMRTLHGMHVHGFPNMFIFATLQGTVIPSAPVLFVYAAETLTRIVGHALEHGHNRVELSASAEDAWVEMLLNEGMTISSSECTPSYLNNEGRIDPRDRLNVWYPKGPAEFFAYIDRWQTSGNFEGLDFS